MMMMKKMKQIDAPIMKDLLKPFKSLENYIKNVLLVEKMNGRPIPSTKQLDVSDILTLK